MYVGSQLTVIPQLSASMLDVVLRDGTQALTANWDAGSFEIRAETFQSDVATGTAPLIVASTTLVSNLNADTVDGVEGAEIIQRDGSVPLTANWDAGSFQIRAETFQSDIATGTAPLTVASTTVVTNLNADTVDGVEGADILQRDGSVPLTANWDVGSFEVRAQTFQSDVATGTAPFTVASTTLVTNLNADLLDGNEASAFATASHNHAASDITSGTLAHERGGLEADISGYPNSLLMFLGGAASYRKVNINATVAPTTTDDDASDYDVGSYWYDATAKKAYVCTDPTTSAAVWEQITGAVLADGTEALTANWDAGSFQIRAETFQSDVATGTAPLTVASTTVVTNLNADTVDGVEGADILQRDGSVPLTANWDVGSFEVRAQTFQSDVTTGTAPLTVASTTVVTNLNADLLDGNEASAFATASHNHAASDITSGTLAHERGGLETSIAAVAIGDIISGSGTGTVALVTSTGHSEGDVLTRQADGSVDYQEPQLPQGYITGLTIANNGTDSDHDIDIATGECRDSADGTNLALTSGLTKRIDAAFSAGTNAGGLFSGTVANNTWYHVFLIKKDSDGSTDAGFSTSISASDIPSGYTEYRRIGSALTDGSANIIGFNQVGDLFVWNTPTSDYSADPPTTEVTVTVSTPSGVECEAIVNVLAVDSTQTGDGDMHFRISPVDGDDYTTASAANRSLHITAKGHSTSGFILGSQFHVLTNTSSQVAFRSATYDMTTLVVGTVGWRDFRGAI